MLDAQPGGDRAGVTSSLLTRAADVVLKETEPTRREATRGVACRKFIAARRPAWRSRCRLDCTSASWISTANSGDDSAAWVFRSANRADASHCVAPTRLGSTALKENARADTSRRCSSAKVSRAPII